MTDPLSETARMSTLLLLSSLMKQVRELRIEIASASLQTHDVEPFEVVLNQIERRAVRLFAQLV